MEQRILGRTGLKVSAVCLGTMTFGQQNTEAQAHEQFSCAVDHGINFIDTAEMYPVPPRAETQGRSEAYIGSWLKARGGRDKLVIATKVTGPARQFDHLRGGATDLTRANIRQAIEDSLKRLQTDYVDLYQLHWPDRQVNVFGVMNYPYNERPSVPIEETLSALSELVQEGKLRHIGVSNETPWGVSQFLNLAETKDLPRIASIQNPYSLLNRLFEVGLSEFAHREGVGLLAYSPLAMGALTGKYLNGARPEDARLTLFTRFLRYSGEAAQRAIAAYVDLARQHGLDPVAMALGFVTSRPFVTSTIVGATSVAQLEADIAGCFTRLPDEVLAGIEAIHADTPNPCP
ncbi:MAG TPA: NADP(H)-dependent aldo-keto reductase [Stellaceae bacterium]|nr:NADP(H)-dependent aldo-keto reductase [Stellaceae bacterium]